jgi:glycine cleavage system regulatory protein
VLAEHGVNIADLTTRSRPGWGGQPHYEMVATVELPERLDPPALRAALEREADRLVLDVELAPL